MSELSCVSPEVGGIYYIKFSRFGRPAYSWLTLQRLSEEDQSWVCGRGEYVMLKHGDVLMCLQTNVVSIRYNYMTHANTSQAPTIIMPAQGECVKYNIRDPVFTKSASAIFLWGQKVVILSTDCISVRPPEIWKPPVS